MLAFPETMPCCFLGGMAERAYPSVLFPLARCGLCDKRSRHDGSERCYGAFLYISIPDPLVSGPVVHTIMYVSELTAASCHCLNLVRPESLQNPSHDRLPGLIEWIGENPSCGIGPTVLLVVRVDLGPPECRPSRRHWSNCFTMTLCDQHG